MNEMTNLLTRLAHAPVMASEESQWAFLQNFKAAEDKVAKLGEAYEAKITALEDDPENDDFWPEEDDRIGQILRPYDNVNGSLFIPVKGSLVNESGITLFDLMTGYQYIEKAVTRGMADPEVDEIVFDIDSPGGEVSGCFDLCDYIASFRGTKPMKAFANDHSLSAAYSIAATADKVYVAQAGAVGSVGVITMHVSIKEMLENDGVKVSIIRGGEHKAEGNPYEDLTDGAHNRLQARIEGLYNLFVGKVAQNRGISESQVRATKAEVLGPEDAISRGMADGVESLRGYRTRVETEKGSYMTVSKSQMASEGEGQPTTQATAGEGTAREEEAGVTTDQTTQAAAPQTDGRAEERRRIGAILNSEEAAARPALANQLAFNTEMSADEAKTFMQGTPEEQKAQGPTQEGSHFEHAMSQDNPGISGNVESSPDGGGMTAAEEVLSTFNSYTGASQSK